MTTENLSSENRTSNGILGAVSTRLFSFNWTKWKPLQTYVYDCDSFLILGRINTKTGMSQFKVKRIAKYARVHLDYEFNNTFKALLNEC